MPVALPRVVTGVFERFNEQRLIGVGVVGSKFAHLIGVSAVSVLVGHGQNLVGLQALP